jgi:hypothetical protein
VHPALQALHASSDCAFATAEPSVVGAIGALSQNVVAPVGHPPARAGFEVAAQYTVACAVVVPPPAFVTVSV